MAVYSSILAWEIPWTEEPGRLQSMGLQKIQTQLNDSTNVTDAHSTSFFPFFPLVFDVRSYCVLF